MGHSFFPSAWRRDLQLAWTGSSRAASQVTELGLIPARGTFVPQARTRGSEIRFVLPCMGNASQNPVLAGTCASSVAVVV